MTTIEKIKVKTENGQVLELVVYDKRAERIQVVLGEGQHSVRCDLTPTRNGLAYAGSVMGREIVYERSREQVQALPGLVALILVLLRPGGLPGA